MKSEKVIRKRLTDLKTVVKQQEKTLSSMVISTNCSILEIENKTRLIELNRDAVGLLEWVLSDE